MPVEAVATGRRLGGARPLRVLIADDHPLMLAGLRRALERDDQIEVVGEAHTAPELVQLAGRRAPDIVVMDLRMPGATGADCVGRLTESWPALKVVVLSACEDRPSIEGALAAGASSYVLKSVEPTDIAALIRQTASGAVFHASGRGATAQAQEPEPSSAGLTGRELTILEAIASGLTTAAISRDLWVSEHTVKFHLTNIYRKLGVANRAAAIRYALEHELIAA